MSEQENVAVIQAAYKAFQNRDIPMVLQTMTEDVIWEMPGLTLPISGSRRGRSDVAEFFRILDETDEIQQFEPREFMANGDTVVVLGHYRARIKSTGATNDFDWVHVFTVRDNRVVGFGQFFDTEKAAKAYHPAGVAG